MWYFLSLIYITYSLFINSFVNCLLILIFHMGVSLDCSDVSNFYKNSNSQFSVFDVYKYVSFYLYVFSTGLYVYLCVYFSLSVDLY